MTTIILGTALILTTGAAFVFYAKTRELFNEIEELNDDYDSLVDRYTSVFVELSDLKIQITKLKRKPRKDKGQSRTTYNGKPVTSKRKSDEGK
jgi:hypothetical protein